MNQSQSPYDELLQIWNEYHQYVSEWWQTSAEQNAIDVVMAEGQHETDLFTIKHLRSDVSLVNAQINDLRRKFDEEHDLAVDLRDGFDAVRAVCEEAGQVSGPLDKRVENIVNERNTLRDKLVESQKSASLEALTKERDELRDQLAKARKSGSQEATIDPKAGKSAPLQVYALAGVNDLLTLAYMRDWWNNTPAAEREHDAYAILLDLSIADWPKRSPYWQGLVTNAHKRQEKTGERIGKTPAELSGGKATDGPGAVIYGGKKSDKAG